MNFQASNASGYDRNQFMLHRDAGIIRLARETIAISFMVLNIILNTINILVFLRMRLKDVMTLCLFCLSLADLFSSFLAGFSPLCNRLKDSETGKMLELYIDMDDLWSFLMSFVMITHNISNSFTILAAIERCLCVAVPFKAKTILSMNRTRLAILGILAFGILMNIPLYTTAKVVKKFIPRLNVTRLEIVYTADRHGAMETLSAVASIVIDPLSIIAVIVTSCIMIRGLRRSSKLRCKMHTEKEAVTKTDSVHIGNSLKGGPAGENKGKKQSTATKGWFNQQKTLSNRNVRLVKMLLILSSSTAGVHLISTVMGIGPFIVPEFTLGGRYSYEFSLSACVFQFVYGLNQNIKIFLYYHYNAKFRAAFLDLMCCGRQTSSTQ